jgi:hypothetical protein
VPGSRVCPAACGPAQARYRRTTRTRAAPYSRCNAAAARVRACPIAPVRAPVHLQPSPVRSCLFLPCPPAPLATRALVASRHSTNLQVLQPQPRPAPLLRRSSCASSGPCRPPGTPTGPRGACRGWWGATRARSRCPSRPRWRVRPRWGAGGGRELGTSARRLQGKESRGLGPANSCSLLRPPLLQTAWRGCTAAPMQVSWGWKRNDGPTMLHTAPAPAPAQLNSPTAQQSTQASLTATPSGRTSSRKCTSACAGSASA